jgi:hypothetical protein
MLNEDVDAKHSIAATVPPVLLLLLLLLLLLCAAAAVSVSCASGLWLHPPTPQ